MTSIVFCEYWNNRPDWLKCKFLLQSDVSHLSTKAARGGVGRGVSDTREDKNDFIY